MLDEIGVKSLNYGCLSFIYKIQVKHSFVYMRIDKTPSGNDERYVVIVDAAKFYKIWTGETVEHCMITDEYEQKNKYNYVIDDFSKSKNNPVFLAEVEYYNGFSITSGVTRTKWLIINGASCFPIECSKESAMRIQQNIPEVLYTQKIENVENLIPFSTDMFLGSKPIE